MDCEKRTEFDQLFLDCEYVKRHFSEKNDEESQRRFKQIDRVLEICELVNEAADEFVIFEELPMNGFRVFPAIMGVFVKEAARQIKANKQMDPELLSAIRGLFLYGDFMLKLRDRLKSEQNCPTFNEPRPSLMQRDSLASLLHIYRVLNITEYFGTTCYSYVGFWLPKIIQFSYKVHSVLLATVRNLPWSLSALFSKHYLTKYLIDSYHNLNLDHPYDVMHLQNSWWLVKTLNFIPNLVNMVQNLWNMRSPWSPIIIETLQIDRQRRFALDWKGGLLDLQRMSRDQISDYLSDQNEIERQQNPGRRHRNWSTVQCEYIRLNSKQQAVESLKRIEESEFPKVSIKFGTVRRGPGAKEINNNIGLGPSTADRNQTNFRRHKSYADGLETNPEKKLLLFFHGGGFFVLGNRTYESVLSKIVQQLGGIPALSVEYSLTVSYPVPLQEILDVYLWLLSGADDVKAKLGFHPKKIILSGDSCGGYYSIALTIVLNELNKMLAKSAPNETAKERLTALPLPSALVLAYPVFSLSNVTPSVGLQGAESVVCSQVISLVLSVYGSGLSTCGDFKRIEKTERFQRIAAKNRSKCIEHDSEVERLSGSDTSPWFHCDFPTFVNRAEYVHEFYCHPFINPFLYRHRFDELKAIPMFLSVGENDFLLDQSIELANLWQGDVCLDVFDKLMHAFLMFHAHQSDCGEAFEVTLKRFQEACGLI